MYDLGFPVWSPNGDKIAFNAVIDSIYGSYYYDLKTKKITRFWKGYLKENGPASGAMHDWHKNLGSLLGIKEFDKGNLDIRVLKDSLFKSFENKNTKPYDFFKLRDTAYINITHHKKNVPNKKAWIGFVRSHSNGNISYWSNEEDKDNGYFENLYLINANGKNKRKIFNFPKGVNGSFNQLNYDISEDSKWLLFSMDNDIFLIDLENTNNKINLTNSKDQVDIMPRFNSDDTKIIYSSGDEKSYFNLFSMDINDENKQAHTEGEDNYIIHARYRPNMSK